MKSDSELLQEFSRNHSEPAFAELVRRNVDLVYSAALRQVNGDVHLARDVAQRVFIDLARKAKPLSQHESLVGWLYTSAHHAAANAVRSERRRRTHEQEAHAMHEIDRARDASPDWEQLRPTLDAAMLELPATDREAVLRRFFSGETFEAIGAALKISDEAARKRVDRALDRLHRLLARRGITSGTSAVALALSHHAVSAAPLGFGAAVTAAAVGGSTLIAGGGILLMNKIAVGFTAAAAAVLIALLAVQYHVHSDLERDLGRNDQERVTLQAAVDRSESEIAANRIKLARIANRPPTGPVVETPDQLRPVTGTERAGLDSTYAPMFRRLRLDREKLAALKELLVLRGRTFREVRAEIKTRSANEELLTREDRNRLELIAARDVDQKIRVLLGDAGLEYVQTYGPNLPYRRTFDRVDRILAGYGASLSAEQVDQLIAWTAAEIPVFEIMPRIPDSVVQRASSILTPLQLEKLKTVQALVDADLNLIAANQVAAEKGLLRLSAASAKEYADRPKTSAPASSLLP